jgi:ABC-type nitrate/sulfonate/bicarbonate transport system substrate-binding protein
MMEKKMKLLCALLFFAAIFVSAGRVNAAELAKVTVHIPSKSLSLMPYYFGKDKGFFAGEGV